MSEKCQQETHAPQHEHKKRPPRGGLSENQHKAGETRLTRTNLDQ
jgi:hypothetical protein